jgi:hypothetical protein
MTEQSGHRADVVAVRGRGADGPADEIVCLLPPEPPGLVAAPALHTAIECSNPCNVINHVPNNSSSRNTVVAYVTALTDPADWTQPAGPARPPAGPPVKVGTHVRETSQLAQA